MHAFIPFSQFHAPTIWQTQAQIDHTISTVYASAQHPNVYELMKAFVEAVQCKEAKASGRFRMTVLNERNWEEAQEAGIATELTWQRSRLARLIEDPASKAQLDEDLCRRAIDDLDIVREFREASFTNMDLPLHCRYAFKIDGALRERLQHPQHSILHAISAWSPASITNYNEAQASDRAVAKFFGLDKQRLESNLKELHNDLAEPLSAEAREHLQLAGQSLNCYISVLQKLTTTKSLRITLRITLLDFFNKIMAIPTNTAAVERGFSLFGFLREPRCSSTSLINMETYMRIVINGPDKLAPYHFNKFLKKWEEQSHLSSDHPGRTRSPGKKTEEDRE
ncbi:hypothetical protein Y032_0556g3384 [Ancylostoma ceylanicum]|uniref:Uncharacterized protein n=1 Tax=Ancylostoma ceylanicum TaxID=53326 RepID=A0A016WQ59_9BILA|nr:hypothetical protein Y032_0556g3384 [Ancylostoma ceylanicum]